MYRKGLVSRVGILLQLPLIKRHQIKQLAENIRNMQTGLKKRQGKRVIKSTQ